MIENKLDAAINNPLYAYIAEVERRQQGGQNSVLVVVSRRNAKSDKQLEPFLNRSDFLYLQWHEVYRWLKYEYPATERRYCRNLKRGSQIRSELEVNLKRKKSKAHEGWEEL